MQTLVNKTARVIFVDNLMLIPGVAQKVGDVTSLLSVYPRFKELVDSGDIVVKDPQKVEAALEVRPEEKAPQEEPRTKRRTARKKE